MFSGIAGVENFSAGGCGEKSKSDIYDACKGLVTSEDGKESDYFWALFSQTLLDSCFLVVVNPHNSPELCAIIPILQKLRPSDINRIDQKLVNKGDEIKKIFMSAPSCYKQWFGGHELGFEPRPSLSGYGLPPAYDITLQKVLSAESGLVQAEQEHYLDFVILVFWSFYK